MGKKTPRKIMDGGRAGPEFFLARSRTKIEARSPLSKHVYIHFSLYILSRSLLLSLSQLLGS